MALNLGLVRLLKLTGIPSIPPVDIRLLVHGKQTGMV